MMERESSGCTPQRIEGPNASRRVLCFIGFIATAGTVLLGLSCTRPPVQTKLPPAKPSDIKVEVRTGGPVILTTSSAEFQILPSGFVQASLLKDGKKLT